MKNKKIMLLGLVVCLAGLISFGAIHFKAIASAPLELTIVSARHNYLLGQPVEISFVVKNKSEKDISAGCFGLGTGEIHLFLSDNRKDFLEYEGGWGTVDAECYNSLKPGDKIEIPRVKILWNSNSDLRHLNQDTAKSIQKGKILNDYAFPRSGTYFIKASAFDVGGLKLESEPIQITISDPVGEDLEVWNGIKGNGEFAYFIQAGDIRIPEYRTDERAKFQKDVREIIDHYPNSFYTDSLRLSLEKFQTNEAKRQEYLKTVQRPNEKPQ